MVKKLLTTGLTAVCLFTGAAFASSTGNVPTSPLKTYSYGLGGGAMYALNDSLKHEVGDVLVKITFMNAWELASGTAVTGDLSWYYAGSGKHGFGCDLGFDYFFSPAPTRPFIGAGVGVLYIDRDFVDDFGKEFGMSLSAHLGFALELTETMEIRLRVPYRVVINDNFDMGVGVEAGFMFFSKLRKVKKLNY